MTYLFSSQERGALDAVFSSQSFPISDTFFLGRWMGGSWGRERGGVTYLFGSQERGAFDAIFPCEGLLILGNFLPRTRGGGVGV